MLVDPRTKHIKVEFVKLLTAESSVIQLNVR